MSGGLLARIRRRDQDAAARPLAAAVLAHISELLNTRHGGSALDPAYGLPDLTDLTHRIPEGLPVLQRSITELLRRHEPRLRKVHVQAVTPAVAAPSLHFEVRAELASGATLTFHTELMPTGRVHVS